MTVVERLIEANLVKLQLLSGSHARREEGVCVMEAVAWFAGEPHTDRPACACPVIAAFARNLNDRIDTDEDRSRLLRPVIPLIAGTKSTRAVELRRAYRAADWAIHVAAPRWLDLHDSLKAHAVAMRGVPPVVDKASAQAARKVARAAAADAADAADAAYAAYAAAADAAYAAYAADAAAYAAAADAAAYAAAADDADDAYPGLVERVNRVAHWQPSVDDERLAVSAIDREIYAARALLRELGELK